MPAADGGVVVLAGAPTHTTLPVVEALVRWDPAWFAARELAERAELSLPPTVRMAQLVGSRHALQDALERSDLPGRHRAPRAVAAQARAAGTRGGRAGRCGRRRPAAGAAALAAGRGRASSASALVAMRAVRSARKEREPVTVRVDPTDGIG